MSVLVLLTACECAIGERMLSNCSDADPTAVCWPCDAGFWCQNGTQEACAAGHWSARGAGACSACSARCPRSGDMAVLPCTRSSDLLCVACPPGYGCDAENRATPCPINTYSVDGACVRCKANTSSAAGATECYPSQCAADEFMSADGSCQSCPPGYGCDGNGAAAACPANTYSSDGRCVACDPNAASPPRSGSADACVCNPGFVKTTDGRCSACKSGTVWNESVGCVLCEPGYYCVGRVHRDVCPIDTYSSKGSAVCMDCRPFSGCARPPCTDPSNCTCDPGYIESRTGGHCARCAPGTAKASDDRCAPCAPGHECLGGNDVNRCGLGRFSGGNLSRCAVCTDCREIVVSRCNATHDSVCAPTTVALAVVTVFQNFRTELDGETFAMFAMIFASSLPKARLLSICSQDICLDCFQGVCPVQRMKSRLSPPIYRLTLEARFNAAKLYQNLEVLSETRFLFDTASAVMRKLTDVPFDTDSRIEHEIICPEGLVWDRRLAMCYAPLDPASSSQRTWVGLVLGICLLIAIGVYGGRHGIRRAGWVRMRDEVRVEERDTVN